MASPTVKFLLSNDVSVANGSTTLTVNGNVDAYHVYNGTAIFLDNYPPAEGESGTPPDELGVSTIELREPWPNPDVVNGKMVAFNSIEGLSEAIRNSREAADKLVALYDNNEVLLTSTDPTVTIGVGGQDVEFVPYQYLSSEVQTLVTNASDAADRLDSLEPRIDAAEQDLDVIEGDLQTYRNESVSARDDAQASELKSEKWADEEEDIQVELNKYSALHWAAKAAESASNAEAAFDNFDDKYLGGKASDPTVDNDGNPLQVSASYWNATENELRYWNGATWDRPEETATQAATTATTKATEASDSAGLSEQFANYPEDAQIPNTGGQYSAFHWKQKAQAIAGGTAPNALKLGGELPSYYATAISINNVDNTSDADKPISTATQAALDEVETFALAGMVM